MMAAIGFLFLTCLGLLALIAGLFMLYASSAFGSTHKSDTLAGLVIAVVGGAVLYWAWADATMTLALRGAA